MPRIIIDQDKCKGCLLCVKACPKNMIRKSNKVNFKGYIPAEFCKEKNKCIGCALCAKRCPDLAIEEVYK